MVQPVELEILGSVNMKLKDDEVLRLLSQLRSSLAKDNFSNYSLHVIDEATQKIKKGYPLRTEIRVIHQNLATMSLTEKSKPSKESKKLLKTLEEVANSGSIWDKMNDLMTVNTWPGK